MVLRAWNPWQALRSRPHIELRFADLTDHRGLWQRDAEGDLIVLDTSLDRRARRCVLAHELIHAERGIGWPGATAATMEREEAIVRREAARRLVPLDDLVELRAHSGEVTLTCSELADHFDVEYEVVETALLLLAEHDSVRRPVVDASQQR